MEGWEKKGVLQTEVAWGVDAFGKRNKNYSQGKRENSSGKTWSAVGEERKSSSGRERGTDLLTKSLSRTARTMRRQGKGVLSRTNGTQKMGAINPKKRGNQGESCLLTKTVVYASALAPITVSPSGAWKKPSKPENRGLERGKESVKKVGRT